MRNYNPVSMTLDMPCQYIESDNGEVLTGHFAFFDSNGTPYVWIGGGTSYTRASSFGGIPDTVDAYLVKNSYAVVKCKHVFPVSKHNHSYHKHEGVSALKQSVPNTFDFAQFVEYGIKYSDNIVEGMPWSFTFFGMPVTHCSNEEYLVDGDIRFKKGMILTITDEGKVIAS